ncbi:hypothetical protein KI616_03660 [Hydrogenophaga taeniospiralis]|nr:hypothetical protein KI616_03660 [Hydrogenophaga taeniospiralis]
MLPACPKDTLPRRHGGCRLRACATNPSCCSRARSRPTTTRASSRTAPRPASTPVRHELRHWLSVVALVSQGMGVAIVPDPLAQSGMAGVVFRPFSGTKSCRPCNACGRKALRIHPH